MKSSKQKQKKQKTSTKLTIILILIIFFQIFTFILIKKNSSLYTRDYEYKDFNDYYKIMNLLIDSETKLSSMTTKQILPNDEKFEDMFVMVYEEENPEKFKIYSMSYVKMLYEMGSFVNSKIGNKYFFIAYCPSINLLEVYNSDFNNQKLDFRVSDSYSTYKTGISCKNAIDNKGREFDVFKGVLLKEKTKLKTINFKILGSELANNIMKEYGVRANAD